MEIKGQIYCNTCAKKFIPIRPTQRFCSKKCYSKWSTLIVDRSNYYRNYFQERIKKVKERYERKKKQVRLAMKKYRKKYV